MGELARESAVMIEVTASPRNREHVQRLIAFAREVLDACDQASVAPILDGSLAVFAYTQNPALEVHDVDFGCLESDFPRLQAALLGKGIACKIWPWHVLQARRDELKIEFDATEHWNRGIPDDHDAALITGIAFRMISFDGLREQYRRGAENTAENAVDSDLPKHQAIARKLRMLDEWQSRRA